MVVTTECCVEGCVEDRVDGRSRCRGHTNEYMREWHRKNPDVSRANGLRKYGLTIEEYDEMLVAQNGVCAICEKEEVARYRDGRIKRLSVDHDHFTDEVRGLLCSSCNSLLANAGDDPEVMLAAINYLER
jgi:hypothetical protein